jgi:predicted nucleic acid-binding protein
MEKVVIDSSVFVKLFLEEQDSDLVLNYFCGLLDKKTKIIVPALFEYEVIQVAVNNNLNILAIADVIDDYKKTILTITNLETSIIKKFLDKILLNDKIIKARGKTDLPSFYDSVYHILAIINDCDFVTADKKHYDKTKHLGHIRLL